MEKSLSGLLTSLNSIPSWQDATKQILKLSQGEVSGPRAIRSSLVADLAKTRTVLAITATSREAEELTSELSSFLDEESVAEFVPWETLPHERLSPSTDVIGRRLSVLRRLVHAKPDKQPEIKVLVASIRAVIQPLIKGVADIEPVVVKRGDETEISKLAEKLFNAGYQKVDLVERRGEYAVRGGLVDVFPPAEEHPIRIEFFGDEVEEVRYFAVIDQRSLGAAENGLFAPPCRELLITDSVKTRATKLTQLHPELAEVFEKVSQGIYVEGIESLSPVLAEGLETLIDLLPNDSLIIGCDPERIRTRTHDLVATSQEFLEASWLNAAAGNKTPIDLGETSYRDVTQLREVAAGRKINWWGLSPFSADEEISDVINLDIAIAPNYRGNYELLVSDIQSYLANKVPVLISTQGHGSAKRMVEALGSNDVIARIVEDTKKLSTSIVQVVQANQIHGFIAPDSVLLTEEDISGQHGSMRDVVKMPSRRKRSIDPLTLKVGDFIVHEQHGVGRYRAMEQRTIGNATREYLVLEYSPSKKGGPVDVLYVPTEQLDLITKYVGGETPTLHRLGGSDWALAKTRARKAVRQIAHELIKLYAARNAAVGYAFSPDTVWQKELEDAFAYNETPDQLTVIEEVKRDMERTVPMDRVVCGDVGYGKTEIAVRAAFKAVQDGKQVAILVPTTLLVQQHFNTFKDRYAQFPIKLAALSRFQTDAEAKKVLADMTSGAVDIVIGTHRLFSKDVKFKDLGLVIVDEEQRFGVEHKEHLKAIRTNVDVLTMSATPIPRTLEMSLTGIREMSTITTPPEQRHPILTFVGQYDNKQVAAAIRRELLRDGQVFYVHNRVNSIQQTATKLQELVPEARIAIAHGQMNEHQLEQIIIDFWEKKFDVLVSTTIVESGLDIPNANTLIIERADAFGLSQLHQLRGRVGRGRERAYAYFLYPPDKPLTETAHERLTTIAQHTDLGSGIQVAMKDLEIRGAGNLLGGEQSGHIADVGFDLYVRLVGEALAEYKGETGQSDDEMRLELPVNAYLPHDYVPAERLRLEMYKRIAACQSESDIAEVEAEMADRYGPLPEPVQMLLKVASLRQVAKAAGLREVIAGPSSVRFANIVLPESKQLRISRLYPRTLIKSASESISVPRPGNQTDAELLEWVNGVITAFTASIV
ncbi:MAG: transcription-repair coupling factor [Actinomycetota bacterium]